MKLLDGHHRWKIIQEHFDVLGEKFTIDRKSFPDRWAAIAWICANQLHKHNMNEMQRLKLIQEEHDARMKMRGAPAGNQNAKKQSVQNEHFESNPDSGVSRNKTRLQVAADHNMAPASVQRAVFVGRGIDKAATVDPEFKTDVLSGKIKARKSDLADLRKLETPEEITEAIDAI